MTSSGTSLLLSDTQQTMMGSITVAPQSEVLALGLYALGTIVIINSAMSIMPVGSGHSKLLSGLMVLCGMTMFLVGGAMAGGLVSMMSTSLYGYVMLVIGVLMIVNGSIMLRTRMRV